MAFFGYTTTGGTESGAQNTTDQIACKFTATSNFNFTKMWVDIKSTADSRLWKCAVYQDDGTGEPGALVADSGSNTGNMNTTQAVESCDISGSLTDTVTYHLLITGNDSYFVYYFAGGTAQTSQLTGQTYGVFNDPADAPSSQFDTVITIYLEGDVPAAGVPIAWIVA